MKYNLEQSRKVMGWKSRVYISNLKIPWKIRFSWYSPPPGLFFVQKADCQVPPASDEGYATACVTALARERQNSNNYTEYNQQWNVFSAFDPSKCAHTHTHTWSSGHCSLRRSSSTTTACNFIQDSLVWNTLNYINIYYITVILPINISIEIKLFISTSDRSLSIVLCKWINRAVSSFHNLEWQKTILIILIKHAS